MNKTRALTNLSLLEFTLSKLSIDFSEIIESYDPSSNSVDLNQISKLVTNIEQNFIQIMDEIYVLRSVIENKKDEPI